MRLIAALYALIASIFLCFSADAQSSLSQDPFVQQELSRQNWEVGGKYQPSDLRGNRVYNKGGDAAPHITILSSQQIGNQLVQQNAQITAVYSYSVDLAAHHPYTSHSPFDDAPISSSQTVSNNSKETPVTLNISWVSVRNHRADAYDGLQGGGYPAPKGARDDYKFTISGTATGFYLVSTTEQQAKDKPPVTRHYVAGQEFFQKAGIDPSQKSIAQNAGLLADKIKQYIAAHPKEAIHIVLDGFGVFPFLGTIPDLANAAFYSFEGDFQNAALSAVAAIPLYGDLTKAGSYVVKAEKSALKKEKTLEPLIKIFNDAAKSGIQAIEKQKPKGIPSSWIEQPAKKTGHTKWVNPNNPHDYVRLKSDGTITQVRNGKAYDVNGNKVPLKSPEAHGIINDDFIFRE